MGTRSITAGVILGTVLLTGGTLSLAVDAAKADQSAPQTAQWTFDKDPAGRLPAGASVFSGRWTVRAESGTPSAPNALCQIGRADYPAISLSDTVYSDVTVSTRFKAVSGTTDRAAGIIFRIKDKDNYYILRANALEDNVNIYRYVGGRRKEIQEGTAKVPSGTWQDLRIEVRGNRMRGFLNNRQVVEATDDTFKAGKIGLWTKEDSVTCFDDVLIH